MKQNRLLILGLLCPLLLNNAWAQYPGGVPGTNLQLWMKPENYAINANWPDASPNAFTAIKTGTIGSALYNFYTIPANFSATNYYTVAHDTKLDANNGAITVFAVGLPGGTYAPFVSKTINGAWDAGWVLAASDPRTDVGFTTGNWDGIGGTNVAKRANFSSTTPYIVTAGGDGAATNTVFVSGNGSSQTVNTSTKTTTTQPLNIGYSYGYHFGGGNIAEVIIYNTSLSANDKKKIQSYLAIKYGITLDQTTANDYVDNNGMIIWNATVNAGYNNNIAGIGNDGQALNQKQSTSINPGRNVIVGTPGLSNTNMTNAVSCATGQYLVWGDNGLSKSLAVPIAGAGINYRFASVWKVQHTGSVPTVRIAWPSGFTNPTVVVNASDPTFSSGNIYYPMSGTQSINGVSYNYVDLSIADAHYFTIAGKAQGPGGVVNDIAAWYRPEDLTATLWTDYSGMGNDLIKRGTGTITVVPGSAASFNFNSTSRSASAANAAWGEATPNQMMGIGFKNAGSVFTIANNGSGGGQVWSWSDDDPSMQNEGFDGWWFRSEGGLDLARYGGASNATANTASSLYQPALSVGAWDQSIGSTLSTKYLQVNGSQIALRASSFLSGADFNANNGGFQIGSEAVGAPTALNEVYWGANSGISECVVFKSNLTLDAGQLAKINSYFGIKYGLTLRNGLDVTYAGTTGTYNYVNSAGNIIWDGTANSAYHNNVAGIARDDNGMLNQKQSRSQTLPATNAQVTISLGSLAASNTDNNNTFNNDQTALVWGDNGNTTAMSGTAGTYTQFTYNGFTNNRRMNRIWKVQNTGVAQMVNIQVPAATVGTTTLTSEGACARYVILYSQDATFGNGDDSSAILAVSGSNYTVNRKFPQGMSYFTFAKLNETAPGNVVLAPGTISFNTTDVCLKGGWKYYYYDALKTQKAFAINWGSNVAPAVSAVTTVPGSIYSATDGTNTTQVMARLLEIAATGTFTSGGGVKVKVFFDSSELNNAKLPNATASRWFKVPGNAAAVPSNLTAHTITGATFLTPSAVGEEDGVDYVQFDSVQSFSTFGFASSNSSTPLPVSLTKFNLSQSGNGVLLDWTTDDEANNKGFEIERTTDGKQWSNIGFVNSSSNNGNSLQKLFYSYTDGHPENGLNIYRLKQIAFDGSFEYSEVRKIVFDAKQLISVNPNPSNDVVNITGLKGDELIIIYDIGGRKLIELKASAPSSIISLKALPASVYHLNVINANGSHISFKLIKIN